MPRNYKDHAAMKWTAKMNKNLRVISMGIDRVDSLLQASKAMACKR